MYPVAITNRKEKEKEIIPRERKEKDVETTDDDEEEDGAIFDYKTRAGCLFGCIVILVLCTAAYVGMILVHDPGEL